MPQGAKTLLIPKRFTYNVWKDADFSVNSPLMTSFEKSHWLYGQSDGEDFSKADQEKIAEQVRTLYISEYQSVLAGIYTTVSCQVISKLNRSYRPSSNIGRSCLLTHKNRT